MLLFWLYDTPLEEEGKQAADQILFACPETFPAKRCFQDLQERIPRRGTFVFKKQNKTKQNFGIEEKHLQWINQCLDKLFLRERYFGLKAQSSVAMFFSCAYHPPSTSTSLRGKREITEERGEGNGVIKFLHAFISAYADNLPVCCTFNHTFSTPQK